MAMADPVGFDVDVDKYITATFNYAAVDFGNLEAGSTDTYRRADPAGGKFNVSVDTNFAYKVSAYGTNFTGATSEFPIGNLKMDTNADEGGLELVSSVALSEASQDIDTAQTGADSFHGFWLSIPAAQYAEAYSSTVTITYANE
jgi:hypothetical protein